MIQKKFYCLKSAEKYALTGDEIQGAVNPPLDDMPTDVG
jgi:hypothetical protein